MKSKPHARKIKTVGYYLRRLFISIFCILIIVGIGTYGIRSLSPAFCANSISCVKDLSGRIEPNTIGIFEGKKVFAPNFLFAQGPSNTAVLGASVAPGKKHIYVDLPTQTLYAYQGNTLVMKTLISSGKWHPTPDGDFTIWIKLRATRMTGGSGADYYDLPNVPYVMFFANNDVSQAEGFSLHGAYWHSNFGHPMSHGCVNMRIVDAKELYDWASPTTTGPTTLATAADPGTEVTIVGSAPGVTTD